MNRITGIITKTKFKFILTVRALQTTLKDIEGKRSVEPDKSDNQFNSEDPGQWNDQTETEKHAFICSHQQDRSLKPEKPNPKCPDGWTAAPQVDSFCYKLITNRESNFDGAQDYCKSLEKTENIPMVNLVSIEDIYEVKYQATNI